MGQFQLYLWSLMMCRYLYLYNTPGYCVWVYAFCSFHFNSFFSLFKQTKKVNIRNYYAHIHVKFIMSSCCDDTSITLFIYYINRRAEFLLSSWVGVALIWQVLLFLYSNLNSFFFSIGYTKPNCLCNFQSSFHRMSTV